MIVIISAGTRTPDQHEYDAMAAAFGTVPWSNISIGTGPKGNSDFVNENFEEFHRRVHSAVIRIIQEMREEEGLWILRDAAREDFENNSG